MPLALEHLRDIPHDMRPIGLRFNNSVTALIGCITTATNTHLDDACRHDLAARAVRRVDEVAVMTTLAKQIRPTISDRAVHDALTTIKTALSVLVSSWEQLKGEERTRLLDIALQSIARFCYLSRPVISAPDAKMCG